MLSTIPGVSMKKAQAIGKIYTCPKRLLEKYESNSISRSDKQELLQNIFSGIILIYLNLIYMYVYANACR
jgi:F0F1-type ATP synthase delta subunit